MYLYPPSVNSMILFNSLADDTRSREPQARATCVPKSLKIACPHMSVSHAVNQSADINDATVDYGTIVYSGVLYTEYSVLRSTPYSYSKMGKTILRCV
jgi:hypothetical protein